MDASASSDELIVVQVATASGLAPPFSIEQIKSAAFFTMRKDWQLEATATGTRLTKIWRDIEKRKMRFLPMGLIVRRSAMAETSKLKAAWDRHADA